MASMARSVINPSCVRRGFGTAAIIEVIGPDLPTPSAINCSPVRVGASRSLSLVRERLILQTSVHTGDSDREQPFSGESHQCAPSNSAGEVVPQLSLDACPLFVECGDPAPRLVEVLSLTWLGAGWPGAACGLRL